MIRSGIGALCLILMGCEASSPLPDMQPGESGRVTKIIDGDGLILDTGQNVRLISIQAPVLRPRDQPAEPYSGESARALEDMALGRRVQLFYPGLTRDRYDRALAHVVTIDAAGPGIWLNRAMIEQGAARVRLYGSTSARGQELLQVETQARAARRGLWKLPSYQVSNASLFDGSERGYFLIDGVLGTALIAATEDAAEDERYAPACKRTIEQADLVLSVDKSARSVCGFAAGARVRLRGWVTEGELQLRHPWHVELLDAD